MSGGNSNRIYQLIQNAVSSGRLIEPFRSADVERACPEFAKNTYRRFLAKHSQNKLGNTIELFNRLDRGLYCLNQLLLKADSPRTPFGEVKVSDRFDEMRDQYIELLKPIFLPEDPVSNDIVRYFASLLRINGMEDRGWDPYGESRAILNDINAFFRLDLPNSIFKNPDRTTWRLGLLLYSHIVEMNAPYEVIANLLRFQLGKGYSPVPFFDFLSGAQQKSYRKRGTSTGKKIEIIKQLSELGGFEIGPIFDDFYNNQLRNAISHSDYILSDEEFRYLSGTNGTRAYKIPYEKLDQTLTSAKAFVAALFSVEQLARQIWGMRKQQATPYDPHYKGLIEVLVDKQDLMCGFRVHWPNNSQSTYRRTEDGIDMINCMLDVKNSTIQLFVGRYAQNPGHFSPLVERDADPVYTKLEGNNEPPIWPEVILPNK